MLPALRLDVGALRDDLELIRPRISDQPLHQRRRRARAAQRVRRESVIGDDQIRPGAGESQFRLPVLALHRGDVARMAEGFLEFDVDRAHAVLEISEGVSVTLWWIVAAHRESGLIEQAGVFRAHGGAYTGAMESGRFAGFRGNGISSAVSQRIDSGGR